MVWVWKYPSEDWGAFYDYTSGLGMEKFATEPVAFGSISPVFNSRSSLKRFIGRHCPPMGPDIVVDSVWQKIILEFVPEDRVQFYPVRLIARGEAYDRFSWVIPFDRVECVDTEKSKFTTVDRKPEQTIYLGLEKVVHRANCLGGLHLARDINVETHCLVSDDLKDALSATGESDMFYRPEDLPILKAR